MLSATKETMTRQPCGNCTWLCRMCRQTWTCIEEDGCRGPGLVVCPPCWAVESRRLMGAA